MQIGDVGGAAEDRVSPDEQIVGLIREQEAGLPTSELCRKHGLSPAAFCKPKARYGGMDLSDAKRLKPLEDENAKLKRLLADAMLDRAIGSSPMARPEIREEMRKIAGKRRRFG